MAGVTVALASSQQAAASRRTMRAIWRPGRRAIAFGVGSAAPRKRGWSPRGSACAFHDDVSVDVEGGRAGLPQPVTVPLPAHGMRCVAASRGSTTTVTEPAGT
jgi:hypothetical protein